MASVEQTFGVVNVSPVPSPEGRSILAARFQLIVLFFASVIFLTGVISPPFLQDDVDAVQAQIARNMLHSGDFVTARLDGIAYMEKAPLKYWLIALLFRIFGQHDWAARLVIAFAAIAACWITARFAAWVSGALAGLYSGLALATCIGMFLFTRILIPDALLTFFIASALFSFFRAVEPQESSPRRWARLAWVACALALLTKGLIGVIFPFAAAGLYLLVTGQLLRLGVWKRILPWEGPVLFLAIALPWHIAAMIANPPLFDFTLHSERGAYHGFFWFYFINEHVLRFLNRRYPRDYNTVPRYLFWLLHLLWFFPWSVYLVRARKLAFSAASRAGRAHLLAVCWIGFVLVFFTFSTTQEYYSLPSYPAFALLIGSAMALASTRIETGARVAASIAGLAAVVIAVILWQVHLRPAPGDIAGALTQNPELYTLSMGHAADLTLQAFAYLKLPLAVALVAALIGAAGGWLFRGRIAVLAMALMMVVFFQAARLALVVFDPYLGTHELAAALNRSPPGSLILDDQYYSFSSVLFYANKSALLLNGRINNLVYGSFAPGAPNIFLSDPDLPPLWASQDRWYLIADGSHIPRLKALVGADRLKQVAESGNKYLFVNH